MKTGFKSWLLRYAAMLLITIVCGVVMALLCGVLLAQTATGDGVGFARLGNFLLGAVAGYAVGAVFGIWAAARLLHRAGTTWQATVGVIGGIALVLLLAEPLTLNLHQNLLLALLVLIPALLAVIGYHLKINWRRNP